MMKRIFNLRNLLAIAAVAAISLGLAQSGSRRSAASTTSADDLNLRAETQVVESFLNDFIAYNKECAQLSKKPRLLRTEIEGVERKSQDLKQRLPNLQNAARSIMNKLKATNKWDKLNAVILANASDPQLRSFFQNINSKAEIEAGAATIGNRGRDIDVPLENLRRKLALRSLSANENVLMVPAAYAPAVPMGNVGLGCALGRIALSVIHAVPGAHTPKTVLDIVSCACNPSCPGCDFSVTGASCSDYGFGAAT